MNDIVQLAEIIRNSRRLCVFTGAGISCPSGIPDFRSANGLYNLKTEIPPEEIISHSFFKAHPDLFYEFYKSKMVYPHALPNEAHRFFAELETPQRKVCVVTQNIDGLHQAAGSTCVYELHGSVKRNYCTACGKFYDDTAMMQMPGVPKCTCGGIIKPDVVLYEEGLNEAVVNGALHAITQADTLIVAGTSLVVYPAASFLRYFQGDHLILINKSPTPYDRICELTLYEDIISVIQKIKTGLL